MAKTSLANVIAKKCQKDPGLRFVKLSATTAGVAEVKEVVKVAKNEAAMFKRATVLFMDEVHRFNKLQQDSFLPHVESGTITLIGATTENPSFSLNTALLSRCRVIVLEKLSGDSVVMILTKACEARGVTIGQAKDNAAIDKEVLKYLSDMCDGDARTALNTLQLALDSAKEDSQVTLEQVKESLKRSHVLYDRKGDEHYHCASALQKSIRGSDDNAALYWTMRMLQGGEDPLYIARRFVRIASEDVGLGDPQALPMAVSAMQGCQLIGKPECNVILAECAVYLARAKKSHEVYGAMNACLAHISDSERLPGVPLHLRNASTKLSGQLGYGKGYSYNLDKVKNIQYMPEGMENVKLFNPPSNK